MIPFSLTSEMVRGKKEKKKKKKRERRGRDRRRLDIYIRAQSQRIFRLNLYQADSSSQGLAVSPAVLTC